MAQLKSHRNLALVRRCGGSPRVFDVALKSDRAKNVGPFVFETAPLNRCILIKHTLRAHEREEMVSGNRTPTKIVFPINTQELGLGGYSLFIEEPSFENKLVDYLGNAGESMAFQADLSRLDLFARAPMFDPFLLRERFRMAGLPLADACLEIDPARESAVSSRIQGHIRSMFEGATKDRALATKIAEGFSQRVFGADGASYASRMNAFFGLGEENLAESLFSWKALLYQRILYDEMNASLADDLKLIVGARLPYGIVTDEKAFALAVQERLKTEFRNRYNALRMIFARYDMAYKAFRDQSRPGPFIGFLGESQMVAALAAEHLALLMHYAGMLRYRISVERALRHPASAIELHRDLESSLEAEAQDLGINLEMI